MPCIECPDTSDAVLEPSRIVLHGDASGSEREHWVHEFRNALGNTTIAASTIRWMLAQQCDEQLDAIVRRIEEGCERCLRLLATMPP